MTLHGFLRSTFPTVAAFALALPLASIGCDDDDDLDESVASIVRTDGRFDILHDALERTELDEVLEGEGPFTVFAPTDAAFGRLPDGAIASLDDDTLADILTYHVISGDVRAADVVGLDSATTVEGSEVVIHVFSGTVVLAGTTQITTTDIPAENGVIHIIDSVLLPPDLAFPGDLVEALQAYPLFDELVATVDDAGLVDTLQSSNDGDGFTVFAPTNFAFDDVAEILANASADTIENILLYHVVADTVDASTVANLDAAPTVQGSDIVVDVDAAGVLLNGSANVIRTDLRADNGIIHVIDEVLTP